MTDLSDHQEFEKLKESIPRRITSGEISSSEAVTILSAKRNENQANQLANGGWTYPTTQGYGWDSDVFNNPDKYGPLIDSGGQLNLSLKAKVAGYELKYYKTELDNLVLSRQINAETAKQLFDEKVKELRIQEFESGVRTDAIGAELLQKIDALDSHYARTGQYDAALDPRLWSPDSIMPRSKFFEPRFKGTESSIGNPMGDLNPDPTTLGLVSGQQLKLQKQNAERRAIEKRRQEASKKAKEKARVDAEKAKKEKASKQIQKNNLEKRRKSQEGGTNNSSNGSTTEYIQPQTTFPTSSPRSKFGGQIVGGTKALEAILDKKPGYGQDVRRIKEAYGVGKAYPTSDYESDTKKRDYRNSIPRGYRDYMEKTMWQKPERYRPTTNFRPTRQGLDTLNPSGQIIGDINQTFASDFHNRIREKAIESAGGLDKWNRLSGEEQRQLRLEAMDKVTPYLDTLKPLWRSGKKAVRQFWDDLTRSRIPFFPSSPRQDPKPKTPYGPEDTRPRDPAPDFDPSTPLGYPKFSTPEEVDDYLRKRKFWVPGDMPDGWDPNPNSPKNPSEYGWTPDLPDAIPIPSLWVRYTIVAGSGFGFPKHYTPWTFIAYKRPNLRITQSQYGLGSGTTICYLGGEPVSAWGDATTTPMVPNFKIIGYDPCAQPSEPDLIGPPKITPDPQPEPEPVIYPPAQPTQRPTQRPTQPGTQPATQPKPSPKAPPVRPPWRAPKPTPTTPTQPTKPKQPKPAPIPKPQPEPNKPPAPNPKPKPPRQQNPPFRQTDITPLPKVPIPKLNKPPFTTTATPPLTPINDDQDPDMPCRYAPDFEDTVSLNRYDPLTKTMTPMPFMVHQGMAEALQFLANEIAEMKRSTYQINNVTEAATLDTTGKIMVPQIQAEAVGAAIFAGAGLTTPVKTLSGQMNVWASLNHMLSGHHQLGRSDFPTDITKPEGTKTKHTTALGFNHWAMDQLTNLIGLPNKHSVTDANGNKTGQSFKNQNDAIENIHSQNLGMEQDLEALEKFMFKISQALEMITQVVIQNKYDIDVLIDESGCKTKQKIVDRPGVFTNGKDDKNTSFFERMMNTFTNKMVVREWNDEIDAKQLARKTNMEAQIAAMSNKFEFDKTDPKLPIVDRKKQNPKDQQDDEWQRYVNTTENPGPIRQSSGMPVPEIKEIKLGVDKEVQKPTKDPDKLLGS